MWWGRSYERSDLIHLSPFFWSQSHVSQVAMSSFFSLKREHKQKRTWMGSWGGLQALNLCRSGFSTLENWLIVLLDRSAVGWGLSRPGSQESHCFMACDFSFLPVRRDCRSVTPKAVFFSIYKQFFLCWFYVSQASLPVQPCCSLLPVGIF